MSEKKPTRKVQAFFVKKEKYNVCRIITRIHNILRKTIFSVFLKMETAYLILMSQEQLVREWHQRRKKSHEVLQ